MQPPEPPDFLNDPIEELSDRKLLVKAVYHLDVLNHEHQAQVEWRGLAGKRFDQIAREMRKLERHDATRKNEVANLRRGLKIYGFINPLLVTAVHAALDHWVEIVAFLTWLGVTAWAWTRPLV